MYINFWYPIGTSEDITADTPFRTDIYGLKYVAFRDEDGKAHVLSDTCVHRGASLGKGKIKNGNVECPYHGWQFGGSGACTLIPSLGSDAKIPNRAKVDSYPTQERYGIVFAFLGDLPEKERPTLYDIPEDGDNAWRGSEVMILDVDYHYERSMENGLDPAHNEFVHTAQGSPSIFGQTFDVIDDPWGSHFMVNFKNQDDDATEFSKELSVDLKAGSGHHGPNVLITWIQFSEEAKIHQYFFEAPVDDGKTRIFFINYRSFMTEPEHDEAVKAQNMRVAQEDINILLELDPVQTPETNTKEILVPSDKPVVRFREWNKEWEQNGWRVDVPALKANLGKVAMAIPCPGRRESKSWVLDAVPLVQKDQVQERLAAE